MKNLIIILMVLFASTVFADRGDPVIQNIDGQPPPLSDGARVSNSANYGYPANGKFGDHAYNTATQQLAVCGQARCIWDSDWTDVSGIDWTIDQGTTDIHEGNIPDTATVTGWAMGASTATTPAANDNDTSIATTAALQTELTAYNSDTLTLTNKTMAMGSNTLTGIPWEYSDSITDPADDDDMIVIKLPRAVTITDIHCLAMGGGTITFDLQECSAAGTGCVTIDAAITCDSDGAEDDGTLSNGAVDAADWLQVVFGAPSGTVDSLAWSAYGVEAW